MSTPVLPRVACAEPACVVAGDTAEWQLSLPLYPSPWILSYALRGAEQGQAINFSQVSPQPTGYTNLIQLLPAVTILWKPGLYKFQSYVTNPSTTDRKTIGWGDIQIVADLAIADPADPRSFNRKTRDILQDALLGRLPRGMDSYTIAGRAISKIPIKELNLLLERYQGYVQQEENQERIRQGKGDSNIIRTAFTSVAPGVNGPWGPRW